MIAKQHEKPPSQLSILIPTYNSVCVELVTALCQEATQIEGLAFEVVVADDGSSDAATVSANRQMASLPNTRYIERPTNAGRAAIRNFLAREARYPHLLFIDSHMQAFSPTFLHQYLEHLSEDVVCGGYIIAPPYDSYTGNLRQAYEVSCLEQQSCEYRARAPHAHFHTSNFMIRRALMLRFPLDERFRHYGYEDVLFGKTLKTAGIAIHHIDNPLAFHSFESNERFMAKTEEGLHTLLAFRDELRGYSRLLALAERLIQWHLLWVPRVVFSWAGGALRRHLTGGHPHLLAFKVYRLGFLAKNWEETDLKDKE